MVVHRQLVLFSEGGSRGSSCLWPDNMHLSALRGARRSLVPSLRRRCNAATPPRRQPPRRHCSTAAAAEEAPSFYQLVLQARLAAVPMVGFGFMDNIIMVQAGDAIDNTCLLYTSPSPRDRQKSRMPSSA